MVTFKQTHGEHWIQPSQLEGELISNWMFPENGKVSWILLRTGNLYTEILPPGKTMIGHLGTLGTRWAPYSETKPVTVHIYPGLF